MRNHKCGCGRNNCNSCCNQNQKKSPAAPTLLKFSGTLQGGEEATAFPCDLADAGLAQCIHEGTISPGLPYPTYPIAQPITLSSLYVDMQSPVTIGATESPIFFQLVKNGQLVGGQVAFDTINQGHNVKSVTFAPVTWQPGDFLTLRSSCLRETVPPEAPVLGISASAA